MKVDDLLTISISPDMLELSEGYLIKRKGDLAALKQAFRTNEFETIERLSHKTKGTAGGYGFDRLGRIAKDLEAAAKIKNTTQIEQLLRDLENHLSRIQIIVKTPIQ